MPVFIHVVQLQSLSFISHFKVLSVSRRVTTKSGAVGAVAGVPMMIAGAAAVGASGIGGMT